MPLTPNFTVSQSITEPSEITVVDTSTGSDATIITRRVYLLMADGDYLVPSGTATDYIEWIYSGSSSTTIDALDKDYALAITVQWLNSSDTVVYTKTINFCFTVNSELFYADLISDQSSFPKIVNDSNYVANLMNLRLAIDAAEQAISYGDDIYKSQRALDVAKEYSDNQNLYF